MSDEMKCAAPGCGRPATRVIDGREFCDRHSSHMAEVEMVYCALEGCGRPATTERVGGRLWCDDHARHFRRLGAAPLLALLALLGLMTLALSSSPARAGVNAVTCGTASANTGAPTPSAGAGYAVILDNESATATIAFNFGGTAALNTAGDYTLGPGVKLVLGGPGVLFTSSYFPLNCIASSAATPATVEIH
jgi:hypothetical protein